MEPLMTGFASAKLKPLEEEGKVLKEYIKHDAFGRDQALDPNSLRLSMEEWFDPAVERLVQKGTLIEAENGTYYVSQEEQEAQAKWKKNRWFIIPAAIIAAIVITVLLYQ